MTSEPLFLDGPAGRIFALFHASSNSDRAAAVVYLPPFAEEMNRARRMASLQARALSEAGFSVLLLDFYGTGDSAGEFVEARWETWEGDVDVALTWLRRRGYRRIALWGLRLGAVLATAAAVRHDDIERLILWQPVILGKSVVTQFFRLRMAASMSEQESPSNVMKLLRTELNDKGSIEIAGYELSAPLVASLEKAELGGFRLRAGLIVDWLEVTAQDGEPLAPASSRIASAWRESGIRVSSSTVAGEPFWATQEVAVAPALLRATLETLKK
jgi:exosortase A-associated hydrolase 2